jgi:hypothetical protein
VQLGKESVCVRERERGEEGEGNMATKKGRGQRVQLDAMGGEEHHQEIEAGGAPTPPPPPSSSLLEAVSSLAPALEILERFHHRNRNQHRLSRWWAQAGMLRRHLRKMMTMMEQPPVKRKKKKMGRGNEGDEEDELVVRATFLRERIVPRAYL